LKCDGTEWNQDLPVQAFLVIGFIMAISNNKCSGNNEKELEGVGRDEYPALASS
jgi:hypothetical protein